MRPRDNPFAPGAGTKPPELVGRDVVQEDAESEILRGFKGRPVRGQVVYGLRGVGKTVLLNQIREIAQSHKVIVADLETPEDKRLIELLGPRLRQILIKLNAFEKAKERVKDAANALQAIASKFKFKVVGIGIEVKNPKGVADSGDLEIDLAELLVTVGEAAKAADQVVLLTLDEMQYLSEQDLSALVTAIHKVNQKSLPIGLFGAALPQILEKAGNAKSYSERLFQFIEIDQLEEGDAKKAIRDPVHGENAKINPSALSYIVEQSQGYPYFLQEWGFRTWNAAKKSPITKADVLTAERRVIESLDKSFFRVRYDRLTAGEQQYLRAMAELGPGPHRSGQVANLLGKKASQCGTVRSKVIAKGMAFGGQYGVVHFSVPLFDQFMRRAMPEFKVKRAPKGRRRR